MIQYIGTYNNIAFTHRCIEVVQEAVFNGPLHMVQGSSRTLTNFVKLTVKVLTWVLSQIQLHGLAFGFNKFQCPSSVNPLPDEKV